MDYTTQQRLSAAIVFALAESQHGVVSRQQLFELGLSAPAIKHRIAAGRLHPVRRGVYAVGRPDLTPRGRWMAAVLACGPLALLSHGSAAELWQLCEGVSPTIDISTTGTSRGSRDGIAVRRRSALREEDRTRHYGIPVTTPICTLIDLAADRPHRLVEAAVNEADKRSLVDPETLRAALDLVPPRPGLPALREVLDRRTFSLTDSDLERRFLRLVDRAGLPRPLTGQYVNGFKVDFHWPELGLVVETDGLRYHRTPAAQTRDRLRDQAHTAAGLIHLRFTHWQVAHEGAHVVDTLAAVIRRLHAAA